MNINKEVLGKSVKWGVAGLAALVVSPIIFMVVKGIVGIVVALVIGLVAINLAPWFGMKVANMKLKSIKKEAAANPVETLQNVFIQRQKQRAEFKEQITQFRAKISTFSDKIENFKVQFPQDAAKFENQLNQLNQMKSLLQRRETKYIRVKDDLTKFASAIERADALWKMGLAAAEMNEAAGVFDGEQMYEKIKIDTAIESVQESMNLAFSEMESDFMEGDDVEVSLIKTNNFTNESQNVNISSAERVLR